MVIDVYLSNISEDVWPIIQSMHPDEQRYEIDENAYLSDRDILMLNPEVPSIIILPQQLDTSFLEYYQQLFKTTNFEVLTPKLHSGELCKDVLNDKDLWKTLLSRAEGTEFSLKSYSATSQFYELVAALKAAGVLVSLPESPSPQAAWTVNYFGSKSGIRQVTQKLSLEETPYNKWMSEGAIAHSVEAAVGLATLQYLSQGGVVLKTNKAHSGVGVEIIPPGTISSNPEEVSNYFSSVLSKQEYWSTFPIIVEKYLDIDLAIGGGNPSCEYLISTDGTVTLLYICGMRITEEGVFKGVEIHSYLFSEAILQKLEKYGRSLGKAYAQAGYVGYYDVDCIFTKNGEVLVSESNVRRTGGTHVYVASRRLLGDDFGDNYFVLSDNASELPTDKHPTFEEVVVTLQPILFNHEKKEGVMLASSHMLRQHKLSYVIIGHNQEQALAIEQQMMQLLRTTL